MYHGSEREVWIGYSYYCCLGVGMAGLNYYSIGYNFLKNKKSVERCSNNPI